MEIKWEDLEFIEDTPKTLKVDLNGHDYWVSSCYMSDVEDNVVYIYDCNDGEVCNFHEEFPEEVNFFNNLELKLIEEVE